MKFQSKTHILKEVREISDLHSLTKYARAVSRDSLNTCAKIKLKGDFEDILDSLKGVPKAILEHHFDEIFGDFYEEDDLDSEEEGELEEEDLESDEDCDCQEQD